MDAANYYEKCAEFLKNPDCLSVASLDNALKRVDPEIVDVGETEHVFKLLRPLLINESLHTQLSSCRLVLRFQRKTPNNQWVGAILDQTASSFRDACLATLYSQIDSDLSDLINLMRECISLWTEMASNDELEEHYFYPLFTAAIRWIFQNTPEMPEFVSVSRKMVGFVAASYAHSGDSACEQILYQIIAEWRKNPASVITMADLILEIVAAAGQVPISQWEEAISYRSRSHIEKNALLAHSRAKQVSQLISRRLVDTNWSKPANKRSELDALIAECSDRCLHPQWASAEIFLSAFVTTLFRLSNVSKSQRYPSFIMEMSRTLYDNLAALNASKVRHLDSSENEEVPRIDIENAMIAFIKHNPSRSQALYLASRQLVEEKQPFYDYYDALKRPSPVVDQQVSQLQARNWQHILNQWPITTYHSQIVAMLCDLAQKKDSKDSIQVDLFKISERVVNKDPTKFNIAWLDRVNSASPVVCETLIPIAAHAYNFCKDETILKKMAKRVLAPGAQQFKRKVIGWIVNEAHSLDLKWQVSLSAVCDSDVNVSSNALQLAQQWLQDNVPDHKLAQASVDVQTTGIERYNFSIKHGLAILLSHLNKAEVTRIQALVSESLSQNHLRLATVFLSVDGRFTPMSSMRRLFEKSSDRKDGFYALQISNYALCARPRLIISPQLSHQMFNDLIHRLKTASEVDIDPITSILSQLVSQGSHEIEERRKVVLRKIFHSAVALAQCNRKKGNDAVFTQAILIAGGARFWPIETKDIADFAHQLIDWSRQNESQDLKLLFMRTIFKLASQKEDLFTDGLIDRYFSSFESSSLEADCFTRQLLKLLWMPKSLMRENEIKYVQMPSDNQTTTAMKRASTSINTASTLMSQKHLSRLICVAFDNEDVNALKVITKAIDDNLVVMDECVPLITALSFSRDVVVAQTALRGFVTVCERWPRNFGPKLAEGFQALKIEHTSSRNVFQIIWHLSQEYSPRMQSLRHLLDHMMKLIDFTVNPDLLKLLIHGFANVEIPSRDAKYSIQSIENKVNMFDVDKHDDEDTNKTCSLLVFALWLRRKYNIREQKDFQDMTITISATLDSSSRDKGSDDSEPSDCEYLWQMISDSSRPTKLHSEQLWRLPCYSQTKIDTILNQENPELSAKRVKIDGV